MDRPGGETRMHADRADEVGMGGPEDPGHRTAGREPGGEDPALRHGEFPHQLPGKTRKDSRPTRPCGLIKGPEPVPAKLRILPPGLLGIS